MMSDTILTVVILIFTVIAVIRLNRSLGLG
jgi:hypothetical protein